MEESFDHIDYPIIAKMHPPMYLMHKYWARKPHNVVREYIEHYSKEDNIVLDPFAGSGVTAAEALKVNRKAIAFDLDPMATFITKCTVMPIDLDEFKRIFRDISARVKPDIYRMYETSCERCGGRVITTHSIWETRESLDNEVLLEVWFRCPDCGDKTLHKREPTKDDFKRVEENRRLEIPFWYPKNELIWNTRINVRKGTRVSDLFSGRNLIALSIINNEIKKIDDEDIKLFMEFTFTSALAQASRLIPVVHGGRECKSWTVRGYWVPPKHFEINAWNCFRERYKKVLRGKKQSNEEIQHYRVGKNFLDLMGEKNIMIKTFSTLNLSDILPPNSVDYVFTDPPYGDAVPYLELDYMWSSWLGFEPDFEDEIIISNSPLREKAFEEYYRTLMQAFKEIFGVLKPDHWMTVTFHSTNLQVYNSIVRAVVYAGFELDHVTFQPPARASAKSLLHPYGSAVGDYYFRFRKPATQRKLLTEREVDILRFEKVVLDSVKKIILERGEPTTFTDVLKGIYVELDKYGYLLIANPKNIKNIIRKHEGVEFVFIKQHGWWFKNPEDYLIDIPLGDRVEMALLQVLRRKGPKVAYDDILQEIFMTFRNAMTPSPPSIRTILEEYATKTKDHKWRLKGEVKQHEREHSTVIGYLAEIGHKAGYDVWIGIRERNDIYNEKPLSTLSIDELDLHGMSPESLENIKMIDVLYVKENKVALEFEVENTTTITSAITRGSYIPTLETRRFIIIPRERINLLYKKTQAPILKDRIESYRWKFIFYDEIKEFLLENRKKKKINIETLTALGKRPIPMEKEQKSLLEYLQREKG